MKNNQFHHLLSILLVTILLTSSCQRLRDRAPDSGTDDCYDRVTETCNRKMPEKDWGNHEYRNCINSGLNWCDKNERMPYGVIYPVFEANGRLLAMVRSKDNAPDPGYGDCYNRVTETCNRKHPNKDWGDIEYRNCVTSGLGWCDINEPLKDRQLFPVLESNGRFKDR